MVLALTAMTHNTPFFFGNGRKRWSMPSPVMVQLHANPCPLQLILLYYLDNILAFFSGNEVVNGPIRTTKSAPYLKALIRDLKKYIKTKPRYIPIAYATNDDPDIRIQLKDYFSCGAEDERIDLLGYNIYSWCGDADTFESSGWKNRTSEYLHYPVPVILSEYGCNLNRPRTFPEVKSIFGPDMQNVFSGGIMYEYTEEDNGYGIVQVKQDGTLEKLPDYYAFKTSLQTIRPKVQLPSNFIRYANFTVKGI